MNLIEKLKERRAELKAKAETLIDLALDEKRSATDLEDAEISAHEAEIRKIDERITELQEAEVREAAAAAHKVETRTVETATVVNEPNPVYRRGDNTASYFKDLATSQLNLAGAGDARARLASAQETRAADMTTVAGAGGEFAPPAWLVEDFVALARPGRVTADLVNSMPLPSGVSSVNLPKVASGASVAVQQTQGNTVSDTAMTTTSVTSGITTLAGKQIVSLQLLQQSGIPFDRVIMQDLAKEYAKQLDKQVLYGSNSNGQVNGLVGVATNNAFTSATPAPASVTNANSLYYVVSKAGAAVNAAIFEPADAIVMHPARWSWILGSVDSNARPLVVPGGPQFNGLGNADAPAAQGFAGSFGGYNVYIDPNISQTANSATNQDEIYVLRRDQVWLWETPVQAASFDATYADSLSILFRVHGFLALIANRYSGAVQSIRGTGLVTP